MSRKLYSLLAILIVASFVLAACAPSGDSAGSGDAAGSGEIIDRVRARGELICAVRTDLNGFGFLDADGNNAGFDVDLCRAVAAAVLGDADAIEFVPIPASDRGPVIQTAEVDLLTRNVTWTSSRDAQWGNFTTIMFYDGQGFMVSNASGITSTDDFDGSTVCVTSGTTTETNLAQFMGDNGYAYEAVIFEETAAVYGAFEDGRCDISTSDLSQLYSVRSGFADPSAFTILDTIISKEPLTPAVPHGDDVWFDIVKTVMWALINGELLGVTQDNVGSMGDNANGVIRNLVGTEADWGYTQLGLDADALANAIAAVGNYGEVYDRYMGPNGVSFTYERGLNEHWTNGGLIYAPPIK
jgi:general L-amino acid transport system substrate-binding protein